jgi:2-iminoacetate synthase ThiH
MLMNHLRELVCDTRPLEAVIATAQPQIARILERSLARDELSIDDGLVLLQAEGTDLAALLRTADHVRAVDVGPAVT